MFEKIKARYWKLRDVFLAITRIYESFAFKKEPTVLTLDKLISFICGSTYNTS